MNEAQSVRVTVEILVDRDRIAGTVQEPEGRSTTFEGWIGLITALEGCRIRRPRAAEGEPK
jgi:hypothetical protein